MSGEKYSIIQRYKIKNYVKISVIIHRVDERNNNMTREIESIVYFGIMAIALVIFITSSMVKMKKTKNFKKTLAQSIIQSFILFSFAGLWWFFQANDGFSQVFGALYYGIAFVVGNILNAGILLYLKKKQS